MLFKIHLSITLLLLLPFQLSCFAQSILLQGKLITESAIHQVPFTNTRDEIITQVRLKGNHSNFILDTGAPLSINRELQLKYKYPILKKVPLLDASNNPDTVLIVLVDTLRLADILIIHIPALVLNLKDSPLKCSNIDGILGSNALRFFILKFDLQSKFVSLTTSKNLAISNNDVPSGSFSMDHQANAFIRVSLDSNFIDTVHFDSGMSNFFDMNTNKIEGLVSLLGPSKSILKGYGSSGQGILGKGNNQIVYSLHSNLSIGQHLLKNININTTPAKSRIGREILNHGVLILDYQNSQFYFKSNSVGISRSRTNFGFEVIHENNKVTVSLVWNNCSASNSGLKAGSQILAVNNVVLSKLDFCDIEKTISQEFSKKKVRIKFVQDGRSVSQTFRKIKY